MGKVNIGSAPYGAGDVGLDSRAAGVATITDGSTGYGSLVVGTSAVGTVPLAARAIASQTANTLEVQNSSGAALSYFKADGYLVQVGRTRIAADVTNATATMANITGLTATLLAAGNYSGKLVVFCIDSTAAEGLKFDFDGGTATMTDFRAYGTITDTALLSDAQTTAIATDFTAATVTGAALFVARFSMTVNAAGTFIPRFAQNSHSVGTATLYRGGYMDIQTF